MSAPGKVYSLVTESLQFEAHTRMTRTWVIEQILNVPCTQGGFKTIVNR